MPKRYCTEYKFVAALGYMCAWAIIDKRQGYNAPVGYIEEANQAEKIVEALNYKESLNVSSERTP